MKRRQSLRHFFGKALHYGCRCELDRQILLGLGIADDDLVRLIAEPHVVGRAALIAEAGRRGLASAKHAIINACHDVISRARQGGENLLDPDTRVLEAAVPILRERIDGDTIALFDRMLRHSNVHVKWELVEDAPRDERLLGGMFHVLGEKWGWQEPAARTWLAQFQGAPAYEAEPLRYRQMSESAAANGTPAEQPLSVGSMPRHGAGNARREPSGPRRDAVAPVAGSAQTSPQPGSALRSLRERLQRPPSR